MTRRLVALAAIFVSALAYRTYAMQPEVVPLRAPLAGIPFQLGEWAGAQAPPLAPQVLAVLGVDEYVDRFYRTGRGDIVSLYIGYYESQRQGDTIHSPLNCLPGAGWQPLDTARTEIAVPGRSSPLLVNEVIIQKGLDRQAVLYWYQSHGRVVASEYWSKFFMVYDAVRMNRSDAALVRVVSPMLRTDERGGAAAVARAVAFVQTLFPTLSRHLPS